MQIITEERLNEAETRCFLKDSFRNGEVKTTGTDIDKLMPTVSRFGGGNRAAKKQTIIDKLKAFFERFFGIGDSSFSKKDKPATVYDLNLAPMQMVAEEKEEDDMWQDDDRITRIESLDAGLYPKTCPVCGENSIHMLMYKPAEKSFEGGCWIWCSSCNRYSHSSVVMPRWWRNFEGIEEDQLFASPEYYLDDKSNEIDAWVNQLISKRVNDSKQAPKTVDEDRTFYVIRIDPQKVSTEEKARLVEQICRCEKEKAIKMMETEGFKLHPMPAIDVGMVKKELEAKGIKFSIDPDYKWK